MGVKFAADHWAAEKGKKDMLFRQFVVPGAVCIALAGSTTGCDTDPGKGKAQAEASAPVEQKEQALEEKSELVQFAVTQENGTVGFVGAKVTDQHEGTFEKFTGTIDLVDGDIEKSKVMVDIDMTSLAIEPEKLQGHLLSDDFFLVEKFPKATFESTSIKKGGDGGASHTVTGNLTLRGETKSITFPATITASGDAVSVKTEFAINRKDFGIVYAGMKDDLIKDNVLIKLTLEPKK